MDFPRRIAAIGLRTAAAVLIGGAVAAAAMPSAAAGDPCNYASDPANSQWRGEDVTISGSFGIQHPNGTITVSLRVGPGEEYVLQPTGMTNASGAFQHTVTIGVEVPAGDYDLVTTGPSPGGVPLICSKPFTVMQFVIVVPPGGFTTETTTTLAETTTSAPTTTTLAPTTTAATTTTVAASVVPETTVATTTTIAPDDQALVAGDPVEPSGGLQWPLLIGAGVALIGLGVYVIKPRARIPR